MEYSLTPGTVIFLVSLVATVAVNAKFAFPARLLVGLRRYQVAGDLAPSQRQRGRRVKDKKDEDSGLGDANSLLVMPTTYRDAFDSKYFNYFDGLFFLAELTVLTTGLGAAYAWLTGEPAPALPLVLSMLCMLASLIALFRVDFLSRSVLTGNKGLALAYGLGAFFAAAFVQQRAPNWAPVQRQQAALDAANALLAAARASYPGLAWALPAELGLPAFRAGLAAAAACLAAALVLPALRFTTSIRLQRAPPAWAADHVPYDVMDVARLHVQFVVPLAASMLWGSMRADVLFNVPQRDARWIQGGALAVVATLAFVNLRLVLQRYHDAALVAWHDLKHPAEGGLTHAGLRAELIRSKLAMVSGLVGRAAVEVAAPAVLALGAAAAQLHSAANPVMSGAADANGLLDAVLGFLAWWSGAAFFLFCAAHMWLFELPGL